MKFTIPIEPRTKKNHQEIWKNRRTGQRFIGNGKEYKAYVRDTFWEIHASKESIGLKEPISYPINIKAVYYMGYRRKVDISNLHSCLHDVLVHNEVILDDSCRIVVGTDGSRVRYDKHRPRTEVEITRIVDPQELEEVQKMIAPGKEWPWKNTD